jgi:hypothetical protein
LAFRVRGFEGNPCGKKDADGAWKIALQLVLSKEVDIMAGAQAVIEEHRFIVRTNTACYERNFCPALSVETWIFVSAIHLAGRRISHARRREAEAVGFPALGARRFCSAWALCALTIAAINPGKR